MSSRCLKYAEQRPLLGADPNETTWGSTYGAAAPAGKPLAVLLPPPPAKLYSCEYIESPGIREDVMSEYK